MDVVQGLIDLYDQVNKYRLSPSNFTNTTNTTNSPAPSDHDECRRSINVKQYLLFYYMLIPSGIIVIILSLLRPRTTWKKHFLWGRPSVPCPVNCLEEKTDRISYVAAFGLITWMLYDSIFQNDAFGWQHDSYFENFLLLGSAFLVGLICYPIFGAISSRHWIGYVVGSVYTWTMLIIYVLANYPCENYDQVHVALELLWALPPAISLVYLSFNMPWRVIKCILELSQKKKKEDYVIRNHHLYEVQHVKRLLNVNYMFGREQEDAMKLNKKIYRNVEGFRYSISVLTAVLVSIQFICMLNLQLIEKYLDATNSLNVWVQEAHDIVQEIVAMEKNKTATDSADVQEQDTAHIVLLLLELACRVLKTMTPGVITCWCLAFVVTSWSLLISLKRYRAHLLSIYKGDWSGIPKFDDMHPRTLVVSSAKFAGYQLGYAAWGFLVQSTLFIAIAVFGMAFILLIAEYKMSFLLIDLAKWAGPLLLYLAFLYITQILLTHFCFLQKDEQGERVLALDNRKLFFNFHYFMIFGNAGLGVMSSILRVLKAVIYGIWVLPRLDMSTLGREFEQYDSGFAAYIAMLKVENAQTNPVLVVFTNLLLDAPPRRKMHCRKWTGSSDGSLTISTLTGGNGNRTLPRELPVERVQQIFSIAEKAKVYCEHCRRVKRAIIRNRWCVLITLHNNPSLRTKRKIKEQSGGSGTISKRGSTLFLDMVTDALDLFIQNV